MKIYETLLLFALVCALAAFFVMWAKWEEEKLKTKEEHDRRLDEISLRLNVEKELEQSDELQDRLSALLCPHNDHVWKDGRCAKCGRMKDAAD